LPPGTWAVHVEGEGAGDLVITAVKPDGKLCGTAFGKPLDGTWDGAVLSFRVSHGHDLYSTYSARLVREKQGELVRCKLSGTRTSLLSACYLYEHLPVRRWEASLVQGKPDAPTEPITASVTISVKPDGARTPIVRTYNISEPFLYYEGNRFTLRQRYQWGSLDVVATLNKDRTLTLDYFSMSVREEWGPIYNHPIYLSTVEKDGERKLDGNKLSALKVTADGKPVKLFSSNLDHIERLAEVAVSGTITLRGLREDEARPGARFEVIDALVPLGADREKHLETVLGKEPYRKLQRWHDWIAEFDWTPRNVKPGDKVRLYILSGWLPPDSPRVRVNGKVLSPLPEMIEIPESAGEKMPPLHIHVGFVLSAAPVGVENILILRPIGMRAEARPK
jgi:hypothetical protein